MDYIAAMSELARVAVVLGGIITMFFVPCILVPSFARLLIKKFPRNKWSGWALVAGDLVWVAYLAFNSPMFKSFVARLGEPQVVLCILVPIIFLLTAALMDELLAPRALGGLLLLVVAPILPAARWHQSNWSFVLTVFAYLVVVIGIILVLSPYQFRKAMAPWAKNDRLCRIWGTIGLTFGILFLVLGMAVF